MLFDKPKSKKWLAKTNRKNSTTFQARVIAQATLRGNPTHTNDTIQTRGRDHENQDASHSQSSTDLESTDQDQPEVIDQLLMVKTLAKAQHVVLESNKTQIQNLKKKQEEPDQEAVRSCLRNWMRAVNSKTKKVVKKEIYTMLENELSCTVRQTSWIGEWLRNEMSTKYKIVINCESKKNCKNAWAKVELTEEGERVRQKHIL